MALDFSSDYQRAVIALNSMKCDLEHETTIYGPLNRDPSKKIKVLTKCLERIGLQQDKIEELPIIHVTGTKGKGSTCSYVDGILRQHKLKTGLFQSPHVRCSRERICVNGQMLSEEDFASLFWHIYHRLLITKGSSQFIMPTHFSMTLLMALYHFVNIAKVDVAILEVGVGGEYDATNFLRRPVACGITSLQVEHVESLGHTVGEIAWHKTGIAKKGVPLVTVQQDNSAMTVIRNRASEREVSSLCVALELQGDDLHLGIAGSRQKVNAALAVQLTRAFLARRRGTGAVPCGDTETKTSTLSAEERAGLEQAPGCLVGRTTMIKRQNVTYYLDGAHTEDSIKSCLDWFQRESAAEKLKLGNKNVKTALVFRMKDARKAEKILHMIITESLSPTRKFDWQRVAFTNIVVDDDDARLFSYPDFLDPTEDPQASINLAVKYVGIWRGAVEQTAMEHCQTQSFQSIKAALTWAGPGATLGQATEDPSTHVQVLVTGSFILVGGALCLLEP